MRLLRRLVSEVAGFHLVSGLVVVYTLWRWFCHWSAIKGTLALPDYLSLGGGCVDLGHLNWLHGVEVLLVVDQWHASDLLEQVERGLRSFPILYLATVHRSLFIHGHVEDGVRLCVATAWANKAFLDLVLVFIFVVRGCIHHGIATKGPLNTYSFILSGDWSIRICWIHPCSLLSPRRKVLRRSRWCHFM